MERRRDVHNQKIQVSEASVEELRANHTRPRHRAAARASSQAAVEKQAQQALEAVYRSPQVRAGKIEALRARIEAGTYHIDHTSLAMKLLGMAEQDAD